MGFDEINQITLITIFLSLLLETIILNCLFKQRWYELLDAKTTTFN